MHLKIINPRLRARRIKFPGTIQTFYPGVIHIFHVGRGGGVGPESDGEVGGGGDGGVAHCAFEEVVRVGLLEFGEGVGEPGWGGGLRGGRVSEGVLGGGKRHSGGSEG